MMQFQPEIMLDKNLGISYPQEILDWIKENTPGMKYIAIKKYIQRDEYKQIMRISFQENPTSNQKPEEGPNVICEAIYKVLQYDTESEDAAGKYKLIIYRKMEKGSDRPVTKHVTIESDSSGERESNVYDPAKRDDYTLLDRALDHIYRLHDTLVGMHQYSSQIINPIIAMNNDLQKSNIEMGANMVRMKEIELIAERERESDRMRLLVEQQRIVASKEKWNTAMKTMNKNGALDKIMVQVAGKFLGDGPQQAEIKSPVPNKKPRQIPSPQEVRLSPPKIDEEEMKREVEKQIQEQMRVAPLHTLCNGLKVSLNQDEEENPDSSIKEYIKDTINEELFNDLTELLNSESEDDAKANLVALRDTLGDNTEEYPKILMIKNRLSEAQQNIITKIFNFEM